MTAQVAVMNTLGIALASDSAVTTSGGQDADKIYSSSDKLFQLSEVAPVAIMKSGDSDFLDIPWETVIKVYRDQLGSKTFAKLSEYADDFFDFLGDNKKMFPQSAQDDFVKQITGDLLKDVWNVSLKRWKETDASEDGSDEILSSIIHGVAAEKLKTEKQCEKIAGFDAAMERTLRTKYEKLIAKEGKKFFKFVEENIPARTHRVINELIAQSLSGTNFRCMWSGIVFAGFGESDYMPAYLEYAVEGMVQSGLRYCSTGNLQISSRTSGWIEPFGQRDVVDVFTDGISREFRDYMQKEFTGFAAEMVEGFERILGREITDREDKKFSPILEKKWIALLKKFDNRTAKSWRPIFRTVDSLPKSELAAAAEMLVNLTKLRLRISPEQETVGGPIDVAIITKGDGFVWIKKKQYYPAELNPHKTGQPV